MGQHDVIVVGAGTAGLFCANFLARYGKKTLLLEHNHQPGGLTGGFWRKKYYFDAGDQSFESAGIMLPLLRQLGLYRPGDWEFADYTIAYEHGSVVMKDQSRALNELLDLFPDKREELHQLYTHMIRCADLLGKMSNDQISPIDKSGLARMRSLIDLGRTFLTNRKEMKEMMDISIPELYCKYLPPSEFRDRMTNVGYRNMPVAMGAGFWFTWFEDYWYYKGGQQALMDEMARSFQAHGGEMLCNRTVDEILVSNNTAKGVKTKDGEYHQAKWVVFAGATRQLYTEILDPRLVDPAVVEEMKTAALSEPLTALYLGVDMSDEELSRYLKTHHTLFFPEGPVPDYDAYENKQMHEAAFTEINWTSMHNPALAPKGKNALVLQTFSSYDWMDKWGTRGDDFARPAKYKELKKMVADQMLETLSRYIPGIKDRIQYQTLGTPLSTIRFTLNPGGASCGWSLQQDKSYLNGRWLSMTTPVSNLYSIGHYSFWPGGVPMAALSGACVAQMIKHHRKFEALRRGGRILRRGRH